MSVILMIAVAMLSGASSVFAGFEWKGSSAHYASVSRDKSVSEMPLRPVSSVESVPVPLTAPSSHVGSHKMKATTDNEIVSGFGSDLPLLIALQQIAPAGYNVSLAPGISPDLSVSWAGGKPWKQILADTLSTRGLGFRLRGHDISIGRFASEEKTGAVAEGSGIIAKKSLPLGVTKVDKIPLDMVSGSKAPRPTMTRQAAEEQAPVKLEVTAVPPASSTGPVEVKEEPHNVAAQRPRLMDSSWSAPQGYTLREVLTDWARKEGVELYWLTDYDYRVSGNVAYSGSFENAAGRLLEQFSAASPRPFGELHVVENSPRILVISAHDAQD
ncbi:MAG: TcpQ domain-containing protein [Proteobacteria bacterium]|nr:TcpQ domain-containing protein [Pseudomonadota bacterium]